MKKLTLLLSIFIVVIILAIAGIGFAYLTLEEPQPVKEYKLNPVLNTPDYRQKDLDWKEVPITTLDGMSFKINDIRNRMTVVSFQATWCPQSLRQELILKKLYEKNKNINLISINIDPSESSEKLRNHIEVYDLDWTFANDESGDIQFLLENNYPKDITNPKVSPLIIVNKWGQELVMTNGIHDLESLENMIKQHDISI